MEEICGSLELCLIKILAPVHKAGKKLTKFQNQVLLRMFQANAYPGKKEICQAAKSLCASNATIEHWFRKTRFKKKAKGVPFKCE